jgi:glucose-6-phosphate isomerase
MTLPDDVAARLGPIAELTDALLRDLVDRDAVARLYAADHTLWQDDPTEVADRLGWIPVVEEVRADLPSLGDRVDRLADGIDHVVVMGMGGSSLFPEVLARTFPPGPGRPQLHVLDTTHPGAVARVAAECPPERTLHLASSKSGSTIETRSHLEWAWARADGGGRFAVITDGGSELEALARDRGFAEVFVNRSDIGGRYSALSLFGIVPALLAGVDAEALLLGGSRGLEECGPGVASGDNVALLLAAAMAAGAGAGRDKLTFGLPTEVATLGLWLEQLVAESLGKDGTGLVPVVGEVPGAPDAYGTDRLFVFDDPTSGPAEALLAAGHPVVALTVGSDAAGIGRAVVVAELATALAGAAIGVQPFDQPDVAAAKAATNAVLDSGDTSVDATKLADVLDLIEPGDHLALQAFVDPGGATAHRLEELRTELRDQLRVVVSLGFGPRFLHSTGQLHKGGPSSIVAAQVLEDDDAEIPIPGRDFGFGHLLAAQAAGDLRALTERGRRAARVAL